MSRLRLPVFTVLLLIAACGGKVLVDSNGGGDQGGGQAGSTVVLVGSGGTDVGTAGSFGTGTGTVGDGGSFVAGGAGFYGSGGAFTAGAAGFYGSGGLCGATICPPGSACCNPQCGICVPIGAGCPAIACGSAGGFGVGGSIGVGGSVGPGGCGAPAICQVRIPGPLPCPNEAACLCNSCDCQGNACFNDGGCQQIWTCALKFNCRGTACYTPQTCQNVINQYGVNSQSMNLALQLNQCMAQTGCDNCGVTTVDAGPACRLPPPPLGGGPMCSGQTGPGVCTQQCTDPQMNTFISKCAGNSCTCFYNGLETCSCSTGAQGVTCPGTGCCPAPGWP